MVSLQDFLPVLGAPWPKITNRIFWPVCDQIMLLTGVRPKPGFDPFVLRPFVKFSKFWPGETSNLCVNGPESFPSGFFTHFGRHATENHKSAFLTCVRPNSDFDWRATKTWFGPLKVRPWVKFSKFWLRETSDLYTNGPESFPSGFFTHSGRPTAKNYESIFLTVMRRNGAFDHRAARTRVRSFWLLCDYFPISVLLTNCATNSG